MNIIIRSLFLLALFCCFGITQAQTTTKYAKATYQGKGTAFSPCKNGAFFDIGTGKCYTCPSGYKRSIHPVTSAKACMKVIKTPQFSSAQKVGGYHPDYPCSVGCIKDVPTKSCWICPDGYKRTIFGITSGKACEKATTSTKKTTTKASGYYVPMIGTISFTLDNPLPTT